MFRSDCKDNVDERDCGTTAGFRENASVPSKIIDITFAFFRETYLDSERFDTIFFPLRKDEFKRTVPLFGHTQLKLYDHK